MKRAGGASTAVLSAYEAKRARNIADNALELRKLGLQVRPLPSANKPAAPAASKLVRPKGKLSALSLWAAPPPAKVPVIPSQVQQQAQDAYVVCEACGWGEDEVGNDLLVCEAVGCTRGYHLRCLQPALKSVPRRQWVCPECSLAPCSTHSAPGAGGAAHLDDATTAGPPASGASAARAHVRVPITSPLSSAGGERSSDACRGGARLAHVASAQACASSCAAGSASSNAAPRLSPSAALSAAPCVRGEGESSSSSAADARAAAGSSTGGTVDAATASGRAGDSSSPSHAASEVDDFCARRLPLLESVRASLHLASIPLSLLCREVQLEDVLDFCRAR